MSIATNSIERDDDWGVFGPGPSIPQGFKGHVFETNEDGTVDDLASCGGYCNGPICVNCGESFCMHCVRPSRVKPCPKNLTAMTNVLEESARG